MTVHVQREARRGVAQVGLHGLDVVAVFDRDDGVTVPEVMESLFRHSDLTDDLLEMLVYPEVTLTLLLPYYPYTYDTDKYDGSFYPPGMEAVPKPFAIVRANQYMLRHSDYLICYCRGYPGSTRSLVETALQLEREGKIQVTNIKKNNAAI